MRPLIDTTEMYLRTVLELEEEGIPPLRARLVERLSQSGPTVSETVARLEADGLLHLVDGRRLELTARGRELATSVMRKHRLAELLLVQVIGLDWEQVHNEACRWEHVISDRVEERLVTLLDAPTVCPHGNPIPGFGSAATHDDGLVTVAEAARRGAEAVVERISEWLQVDEDALTALRSAGVTPGSKVALRLVDGQVRASIPGSDRPEAALGADMGAHVFVRV